MVVTPLFFYARRGAPGEPNKNKKIDFHCSHTKETKEVMSIYCFIVHDKSYITREMSGHLKCD
jgi:hypothetical protein